MKAALSLLVLIATINFAHASAGPPPFTNESPLITGTDGTYQAIVRGTENEATDEEHSVTGVFSFVISGGIQTSTSSSVINSWVFFVDGVIVQGPVVAAISQSKVLGVLSGGTTQSLANDSNGRVNLPAAFIVPGNTASGRFEGTISYNSPLGAFEGTGTLQGAELRIDKLVVIFDPTTSSNTLISPDATGGANTTITSNSTNVTSTFPVSVTDIPVPGSTFGSFDFEFHGTRVSTTPATGASDAAAAPSPSS